MEPEQLPQTSPIEQSSEKKVVSIKKANWINILVVICFSVISFAFGIFLGSKQSKAINMSDNSTQPVITHMPVATLTPPEKGKIQEATLIGSDLFVKLKTSEAVEGLGQPGFLFSSLSIGIDRNIKPLCEKCENAVTTTKEYEFLKNQAQSCSTSSECILFGYGGGGSGCGGRDTSLKTTTADQISSNLSKYFKVNKYSYQLPACGVSAAYPVASACINNLCQTVYKGAFGQEPTEFRTTTKNGDWQDLDVSKIQ